MACVPLGERKRLIAPAAPTHTPDATSEALSICQWGVS